MGAIHLIKVLLSVVGVQLLNLAERDINKKRSSEEEKKHNPCSDRKVNVRPEQKDDHNPDAPSYECNCSSDLCVAVLNPHGL